MRDATCAHREAVEPMPVSLLLRCHAREVFTNNRFSNAHALDSRVHKLMRSG